MAQASDKTSKSKTTGPTKPSYSTNSLMQKVYKPPSGVVKVSKTAQDTSRVSTVTKPTYATTMAKVYKPPKPVVKAKTVKTVSAVTKSKSSAPKKATPKTPSYAATMKKVYAPPKPAVNAAKSAAQSSLAAMRQVNTPVPPPTLAQMNRVPAVTAPSFMPSMGSGGGGSSFGDATPVARAPSFGVPPMAASIPPLGSMLRAGAETVAPMLGAARDAITSPAYRGPSFLQKPLAGLLNFGANIPNMAARGDQFIDDAEQRRRDMLQAATLTPPQGMASLVNVLGAAGVLPQAAQAAAQAFPQLRSQSMADLGSIYQQPTPPGAEASTGYNPLETLADNWQVGANVQNLLARFAPAVAPPVAGPPSPVPTATPWAPGVTGLPAASAMPSVPANRYNGSPAAAYGLQDVIPPVTPAAGAGSFIGPVKPAALGQSVGLGAPAAAPARTSYTVKPGDTLASVAAALGISVEALVAMNGGSSFLSVGQQFGPNAELYRPAPEVSIVPGRENYAQGSGGIGEYPSSGASSGYSGGGYSSGYTPYNSGYSSGYSSGYTPYRSYYSSGYTPYRTYYSNGGGGYSSGGGYATGGSSGGGASAGGGAATGDTTEAATGWGGLPANYITAFTAAFNVKPEEFYTAEKGGSDQAVKDYQNFISLWQNRTNRPMTPEEVTQVLTGFDAYTTILGRNPTMSDLINYLNLILAKPETPESVSYLKMAEI